MSQEEVPQGMMLLLRRCLELGVLRRAPSAERMKGWGLQMLTVAHRTKIPPLQPKAASKPMISISRLS